MYTYHGMLYDKLSADPIFEEISSGLTFAEMSNDIKDNLSHRGKAIAKLIPELKKIFPDS